MKNYIKTIINKLKNKKKEVVRNVKESNLLRIRILNSINAVIIIVLIFIFINNFNQIVRLVKDKMRTQTTQMMIKSAEQENLLVMEEVDTWYQNCLALAASCTNNDEFCYDTAMRITNAAQPLEECVLLSAYDVTGNGYISEHKSMISWNNQCIPESELASVNDGRSSIWLMNKDDEKFASLIKTRDGDNLYDYDKYLNRDNSNYIVIISVPVYNQYKQVVGGISGYYDASKLIKVLGKDTSLTTGNTIIFNQNNEIIAFRDKETVQIVVEEFDKYKVLLKENKSDNMLERQNEHLYIVFQYNHVADWVVAKVAKENEISEYAGLMTYETKELVRKNLILMLFVICLIIYLYLRVLQMEKYVRIKMEEELDSERVLRSYLENRIRQDAMTGLFHKNAAQEMMNQMLDDYKDSRFAFFFIDIDDFKKINDTYGHASGDYVIHKVTYSMREIFPDDAIIGRYGGDEFMILLKMDQDEHTVNRLAKELCERINNVSTYDQFKYSISVGIAFTDRNTRNLAELKQKSDQAMYQTKKRGKNGYTIWK